MKRLRAHLTAHLKNTSPLIFLAAIVTMHEVDIQVEHIHRRLDAIGLVILDCLEERHRLRAREGLTRDQRWLLYKLEMRILNIRDMWQIDKGFSEDVRPLMEEDL